MIPFAIIFIVVVAVLVTLVVLAQNPKGSGLSGAFGGSGATQLMGAKRTTDVLEKITWGMGAVIFALSLMVNVSLNGSSIQKDYESSVQNEVQQNIPTNQGTGGVVPIQDDTQTTTTDGAQTTTTEGQTQPEEGEEN